MINILVVRAYCLLDFLAISCTLTFWRLLACFFVNTGTIWREFQNAFNLFFLLQFSCNFNKNVGKYLQVGKMEIQFSRKLHSCRFCFEIRNFVCDISFSQVRLFALRSYTRHAWGICLGDKVWHRRHWLKLDDLANIYKRLFKCNMQVNGKY